METLSINSPLGLEQTRFLVVEQENLVSFYSQCQEALNQLKDEFKKVQKGMPIDFSAFPQLISDEVKNSPPAELAKYLKEEIRNLRSLRIHLYKNADEIEKSLECGKVRSTYVAKLLSTQKKEESVVDLLCRKFKELNLQKRDVICYGAGIASGVALPILFQITMRDALAAGAVISSCVTIYALLKPLFVSEAFLANADRFLKTAVLIWPI